MTTRRQLIYINHAMLTTYVTCGLSPLQQNAALPEEHAKRSETDHRPEHSSRDRSGIDDPWYAVHRRPISELLEHLMHIHYLRFWPHLHRLQLETMAIEMMKSR